MLAGELARTHPGAAASLREGLAATATVPRLGVTDSLKRTISSTSPIESMTWVRATYRQERQAVAIG